MTLRTIMIIISSCYHYYHDDNDVHQQQQQQSSSIITITLITRIEFSSAIVFPSALFTLEGPSGPVTAAPLRPNIPTYIYDMYNSYHMPLLLFLLRVPFFHLILSKSLTTIAHFFLW